MCVLRRKILSAKQESSDHRQALGIIDRMKDKAGERQAQRKVDRKDRQAKRKEGRAERKTKRKEGRAERKTKRKEDRAERKREREEFEKSLQGMSMRDRRRARLKFGLDRYKSMINSFKEKSDARWLKWYGKMDEKLSKVRCGFSSLRLRTQHVLPNLIPL